jgi:putative (di)nucleoside polyphosphate hydrolase
MKHLPYRPCVGIMLLNKDRKVFVAQRIEPVIEAWQMPQGGIDAGEDPSDAARRELAEEIGTSNAEIIAESSGWLTYDLPPELIGTAWKGKYRGQRMKWFAMAFQGQDSDIDINTAQPEFNQWRWEEMHRLPDLIVPFKRVLYQQLVTEFGHLDAPLGS